MPKYGMYGIKHETRGGVLYLTYIYIPIGLVYVIRISHCLDKNNSMFIEVCITLKLVNGGADDNET